MVAGVYHNMQREDSAIIGRGASYERGRNVVCCGSFFTGHSREVVGIPDIRIARYQTSLKRLSSGRAYTATG